MASYAEKVVAAASDGVRADKMIKQVFSSKQILAKIIKPIIPGLATMPDRVLRRACPSL